MRSRPGGWSRQLRFPGDPPASIGCLTRSSRQSMKIQRGHREAGGASASGRAGAAVGGGAGLLVVGLEQVPPPAPSLHLKTVTVTSAAGQLQIRQAKSHTWPPRTLVVAGGHAGPKATAGHSGLWRASPNGPGRVRPWAVTDRPVPPFARCSLGGFVKQAKVSVPCGFLEKASVWPANLEERTCVSASARHAG